MTDPVEQGELTAPNLRHYTATLTRLSETDLQSRLQAVEKAATERAKERASFDATLDRLVALVSKDFLTAIDEAEGEGRKKAELFCFDGSDKFEDGEHSILFLVKGPRKLQQEFFHNLGLLPFLPRLYQVTWPYKVEHEYLPESNENIISAFL